jgi:ribokinase
MVVALAVAHTNAFVTHAPGWARARLAALRSAPRRLRAGAPRSCAWMNLAADEPDVVVVGSCNYDQFVYVPEFAGAGATIYGTEYRTGFGGKGANQCIMAAKLGVKTAMVGALGNDPIAKDTRDNFKQFGVNTECLVEKAGSSGIAQICVRDTDGENHIVLVPGANGKICEDDIDAASPLISRARVVLLQNEIPPRSTLAAMQAATTEKGAATRPLVILNAAPAPSVGDR